MVVQPIINLNCKTEAIMRPVVSIQTYFRNNHRAHGKHKEKGGCGPQLPNKTRWQSQEMALKTF